jgi:epoxyqueuosine reductase
MENRELIIGFCSDLGIDCIGFTECRVFHELREFLEMRKDSGMQNEFEAEDVEQRINPFIYMSEGKTIISMAFPYLFEMKEEKSIYFSKYTLGDDYHKVVESYLKKVCEFIESLGGKAKYFVDSNPLPERYIAHIANVGFIGKSNMLITSKYGSYVFLGEIITDLKLVEVKGEQFWQEQFKKISNYEQCGSCSLCFSKCPTKAINKNIKNCNVCLSYITQKKHIEDKWFPLLGGRLFGCDSCQNCCPYNQDVKMSPIEEFIPKEYMKTPHIEELINLDNKTFKDKYANTSCGWRGKNVIQRNAFISAFNMRKNIEIKEIKSPYVKDYYDRLLKLKQL